MEKGGERSRPSIIWAVRSLLMHADLADYWLMGLGFIGAVGDGLSGSVMLIIMSQLVNTLGAGPSSSEFKRAINQNSLYLLYLAAGTLVFAFFEGYCWTRTGERQATRMRGRYLKAVLRQDVAYFDLKLASTAELINCVSTDCFVIQDLLSEKVPNLLMNAAAFIGNLIVAFLLLWRLALIVFPTILLLIIPGLIYGRVLLTLARQIQLQYNKAGQIADQAISSIRTVYSSVSETLTVSSFSSALNSPVRLGLKQGMAKGLAFGSNALIFSIWSLMAWYGGRLVVLRDVRGGTIFSAGGAIISGGLSLGLGLSNVRYLGEGLAAAERIKGVMERKPAIDSESEEGGELGEVRGEVEFREVRFGYPARAEMEVMRGFSLRVEGGKTVGLVGGSGSGKSTAVALLQRYYDPASGGIEVDGVDIRRLKVKWWRGKMGMVSQEPLLFDMSIWENVLFGKEDASMEEVVEAAKKANADHFISQLPMGYHTQVGERGVQLSGGQKQRIAIARALIREPKILLLDEATSALDSESERVVQEAIDAAAVGRTTIVIAHRLSTIRNAHSIAFIHSGQVVETGTHQELIDNPNSHYSNLIRVQQSQPAKEHEYEGSSSRSMSRRFSISSSTKSTGEIDEWNQGNGEPDPRSDRPVPSLRRLLMMNAPEWRQALLGGLAAVLFGAVQPAYSYTLSSMIMVYFVEDREEMKEKIRTYAFIFVGFSIFSFAANVIQHYNLGVMGECLTRRVRERMLSKILTFEVGWFDEEDNSTAAICSRLAKDAGVVRSLVGDRMTLIIQALSAVTVAFTLSLIIAWRVAFLMIATQPLVIACFYARRVLLGNISAKSIKSQSQSTKLAAEAVTNLRTITSFSSQSRILRLFNLAQSLPRRQSLRQSYLAGLGLALSQSLIVCTWAIDFWYGGLLVHRGTISSKALIQTFVIVVSTGRVIADAGSTTTDLAKGAHSVASVFSILDRFSSIEPDDPEGFQAESLTGSIDFRGVEFAYPARPDVPILQRFSLSFQPGKSTAIVGPSGCGKSTIISLIERFYDPIVGVVRIDGRDIRAYNLRALRRQIAMVGQEPTLFAGTVMENIAYGLGESAAAGEVEAAARAANAHDFISGLKDGYETCCGERGVQLSGGQKQRIAIARAILRNPKILLLDEATSALDGRSEKVVQEALERVMVGRTSVVVAHRLSTVRDCDLIAVMEKGRLVEKGSHGALMGKGEAGIYYGLVSLQLGKEGRKG